MKDNNINIGIICNNGFAQHLGVTLFSMFENCSAPNMIRLFILDDEISSENKKKLDIIISKFKAKAEYLKPDKSNVEGLKSHRHFGKETYYKFSLFDSIKVPRILYIDGDLVIKGDIKELFNTPMNGKVLMAVKNFGIKEKEKERLGIPKSGYYFNAGVLLIDSEKWRKEKITNRAIKYIKDNYDTIQLADQEAMNATLKNEWGQLDPSWNLFSKMAFYRFLPFLKVPDYENENINRLFNNPKIIHYAGFVKPWHLFDFCPYKMEYLYYLRKTPWKDYKYVDLTFDGLKKRVFFYKDFITSFISNPYI